MQRTLAEQFHDIYSIHFRDIYSYISYSVGSVSLAEDLTQEVFLKAYRAFPKFRGDSDVRTWLYAIARNSVRSYFSRKKPAFSSDDELAGLISNDPQPEQAVTDREHLRLLHKALLQLTESQRSIVIIRYIHGHSTRETAQILACSETNVKVQLYRALRKLRKILASDPAFAEEGLIASKEVGSL